MKDFSPKTPTIKTVEKALGLLDLFANEKSELTATQVAEKANMDMSSAYKFLSTLTKSKFLDFNFTNKKYRLGVKLITYGNIVQENIAIKKVALPFMESLSAQTEETVHLVIRDGFEGIFVEKINSTLPVGVRTKVGNRAKLNCGASLKVILAFMPDSFINDFMENEIESRTEHTITDSNILWEELKKIRRNGYAISFQELNVEAAAVSAPIFYSDGKIAAGIAIAGLMSRFTEDKVNLYIKLCMQAAKDISISMGYKNAL